MASARDNGRHEPRVGLFVDASDLSDGDVGIIEALRQVAEDRGRVIEAVAYRDWSAIGHLARAFRERAVEPRMVVADPAHAGAIELNLSLDVIQTLASTPTIDVYVLVSRSCPLHEVTLRLRRADRRITLVRPQATGPECLDIDEEPACAENDEWSVASAARFDVSSFDWEPFVRLVDDLERSMPFVGFGWLLKKKLNHDNCGCATSHARQGLMDRAVKDGLLALYKVNNIDDRADPVTACRLNRESPLVRRHVDGGHASHR